MYFKKVLYKTNFLLKKPSIIPEIDLSYFPSYSNLCFVNPYENVDRPKQKILRRKTLDKVFTPENFKALESEMQTFSQPPEVPGETNSKPTFHTDDMMQEKPVKNPQPVIQSPKNERKIVLNQDSMKKMQTMTKFSVRPTKAVLLSDNSFEKDNRDYEDLKFTEKTLKVSTEKTKAKKGKDAKP